MLAAAQRRYECYVVEGWSGRRTPLVLHWIGNVPDLLHNPLLGSRKGFLHSATQQASVRARKDFSLLSEDLLDSRLEWTLVYWSGPNGLIYWSGPNGLDIIRVLSTIQELRCRRARHWETWECARMRKTDTKSRPLRDEQTPLVDARTTLEPSPWWRTLFGGCSEIWRKCSTGCRTLLQCLTEQFNSARTNVSVLSRACCDFIGSCRPVVSLARFFSKPEEKASSRLKRLCRNSTRASTGAGLARVAAARRGVRLRPWRAVRQRRREWLWSQSQVGRVLSNTYYALHRFFAPVGPRHSRTRSYGAYRRARDALHACVTPLLRCCFVGLFCGVLSALSPVVGSCAATVASYGVVITASRLAPAAHGPDCRQATILGVVCATAILVSPLAGMGAACFLAVCPTSCLWWPPKESLAKASMAVYVKAVTYKGKPFFFVRMQFGKGSERKELCGPRHVTEEAAKRDKESLDGKPIDEQLAGVASLELLETKLPSREALRQLML